MLLEAFTYKAISPSKELENFVSHYWLSRCNEGVQNYFTYHSTASTKTELVFAFCPKNKRQKNSVFSSVQGHTDTFRRIDTGGFSEMFGIPFYSHAIPFLFDVPASALANQLLDLSELLGSEAGKLSRMLAHGSEISDYINIVSRYLLLKSNKSRTGDQMIMNALRRMREAQGRISIQNLASDFPLSQKQFERRFKAFSGFSPKLYSRILRFESSFLPKEEKASSAQFALDLGYYDQAHFINDFREFSGFCPSQYKSITAF